ncbi:MAG: hypothetical protein Q7J84_01680, partial [Sulfuricaulis sp.]|nr:hypothetical protein [Sulfuricaulis sp.]
MAITSEYALMAGVAYRSTRAPINRIPTPLGWTEFAYQPPENSNGSGFEAISFQRGTEIVIAFAGTGPGIPDWLNGNIPLALGNSSEQLKQAAAYYMQVQRANPNALIT